MIRQGNPLEIGIGMEMAGVPKAVHGAFTLVSPVYAKPNGVGPVAAGVRLRARGNGHRHTATGLAFVCSQGVSARQ